MGKDVSRARDKAVEDAVRRYQYGRSPGLEARGELAELCEAQHERLLRPAPPAPRPWWRRLFGW
jgi:hypothetical protein